MVTFRETRSQNPEALRSKCWNLPGVTYIHLSTYEYSESPDNHPTSFISHGTYP